MNIPVPAERIEQTIRIIRGHRVMLDADLADLYDVEVKQLKRQVRRNGASGFSMGTDRVRRSGSRSPS